MVPQQLPAVDVTIDLRPVLVSGVFPPSPRRRPLALVVEDDDDTRDLMAGILERDGIDVLCATGRESALDVLAHWPVDVVTLDIGLPDGDGLDVCSAIRSRAQRPDVPVLAVTARATFEAELRSFMSGVDDYLVKPVSAAGLVRRVRGLLQAAS